MIIRKKLSLTVITFYLLANSLNYLFANSNTGATFLKIGIGARAIGMGSAFTAVSDDVTAIHWNPAGPAQLKRREISAMHTEWLVDTKLDFIGFAFPLTTNPYTLNPAVIGGSVIYLSQSELEKRDETGKKIGSFNAADLAVTLSYSKRLAINGKQSVLAGVNIKFIRQQIESHQTLGIAFDLGSLYRFTTLPLTAGLSIQNLGPQTKFINKGYNLPLTIACGISYKISGLNFAADVKQQVYENKTTISFGTDYYPVKSLGLRAGYLLPLVDKIASNESNNLLSDWSGLAAGIGIYIFNAHLDYSFLPYGSLGQTHHITFSVEF